MRDDRPPRRTGTTPSKLYEQRLQQSMREWARRNRLRHAIGATLAAAQMKHEEETRR